ncbi:exonuclease SbcCD subunit D [Saxibacter everestensis]|uniref:Nuclease SbcCD subunit D n=1 Tax=Saxibacter everestensis TaxID=2909229 RepID=A0ABY8QX62_9MICO|nr:exonuclease SbcCD subunit D [Brevibacteriaceae bacterium ZFBP1038]
MRILHTSDWHLGRSFHGVGMAEAQRQFLDFLITTVAEQDVDVVVVAGDVYDRALPAPDTVDLLDDALHRLISAGARVFVTSGNHDSARRLGFARRLVEASGLSLRTRLEDIAVPLVLDDEYGPVLFYGIPYLEPALTTEILGAAERSHTAVLTAATAAIRADLEQRSAAAGGRPLRSVVAAHAFVSGAEASESERKIAVGGVESVSRSVFDGFDYVALGHLHGRQRLSDNVRYSGSPLPYSFSEAAHTKGAWLIDLDASGVSDVSALDAPVYRRLVDLEGELEHLLEGADYSHAEDAFVSVTLTDASRPKAAMERLTGRFPHTVALKFAPAGRPDQPEHSYSSRLRAAKDDVDVCTGFVEHVSATAVTPAERSELRAAVEAVRLEEAEV